MTKTRYTITPIPQPGLSTARVWEVTGGTEPYVVRCDERGEWCCSCKDHFFRRGNRAREGHHCKHVNLVKCHTGDHKFMDRLTGPECVRCGMSQAEFEFHEYGPPDEPMTPSRHDY